MIFIASTRFSLFSNVFDRFSLVLFEFHPFAISFIDFSLIGFYDFLDFLRFSIICMFFIDFIDFASFVWGG
jgi:hypothetical protein